MVFIIPREENNAHQDPKTTIQPLNPPSGNSILMSGHLSTRPVVRGVVCVDVTSSILSLVCET